jgi:pectate lyase
VRNRAELVAALSGEAAPRIVLVDGRFSMSVDAANKPLGCTDHADPAYDLAAFLQAYDPAVWGRAAKPSGPLEEARVRSAKRQGDQIKINVPSDTTVIGINAAYDPDFTPDAGWVPTLRPRLDPTLLVPVIVKAAAGSRRLGV